MMEVNIFSASRGSNLALAISEPDCSNVMNLGNEKTNNSPVFRSIEQTATFWFLDSRFCSQSRILLLNKAKSGSPLFFSLQKEPFVVGVGVERQLCYNL